MIGFFPGFKMPFHVVNTIASRVWASYGLENVMTTANGFMVFRFKTEAEMHVVLEKGPWMFEGKAIILQQWHPHFVFDKNKISKLPVWIRLHGLPFPLWSKSGLSLAASMVGKPLSCDEQTYNCTRLDYARVCVEIDASLPFIHQFDMESKLSDEPVLIQVEYEWRPPRCEKCCVFGHVCRGVTTVGQPNTVPCPTNVRMLSKEAPSKVRDTDTQTVAANPTVADSTPPATSPSASNFLVGVQAPSAPTPPATSLATNLLCHGTPVGSGDDRLHLLPSTSKAVLQGTRGEEAYESDHTSEADPLSVEECQHLITGFPPCVESKMVAFASSSEASSTAKDSSFDTSSIQTGTSPSPSKTKKKKGKKMKKAISQ
jgi:hypothetical protein